MNGNERVVCYLDLLGFSNYTKSNPKGALWLLDNYQTILHETIRDGASDTPVPTTLKKLHEMNLVSSFEYFIPFSDSIFITSKEIDDFIFQVSSFLIKCFWLTADKYTYPVNKADPCYVSNGEWWYPTFFRGGMAFGKVIPFELESIKTKNLTKVTNLTGEALVQAVGLERTDKGPRLFCSLGVQQRVEKAQHFIVSKNSIFEVLWPMRLFSDENSVDSEVQKIDEIFIQASNLYNAYGMINDIGKHYLEFIKLISHSSLQYFNSRKCISKAKDRLSRLINQFNLGNIKDDLLTF
ncbi:MAG: hypothetical protein ABII93_07815 [Chrysiogenia bacterium]